jgi:hypothetical protein
MRLRDWFSNFAIAYTEDFYDESTSLG